MRLAIEIQKTSLASRSLADLLRGLGFDLVEGVEKTKEDEKARRAPFPHLFLAYQRFAVSGGEFRLRLSSDPSFAIAG